MESGSRAELLSRLADAVGSVAFGRPTRVAVDGPPAAGKTTLADELAVILRTQGREVIRGTIEGFLFPRSRRFRRGEYSAEGNYFDSHDWAALRRVLLDPLGPGGDRRYRDAVYDSRTDTALSQPLTTAPVDAVLLFDGVFLLRPELIDGWDLRIFVSVAFEETLDRARIRADARGRPSGSGGPESIPAAEVERRWHQRYKPGQELYFDMARPTEHADIVVHNDDLRRPTWEVRAR